MRAAENKANPADLTGRARLRDAALELFAAQGFEATSTRAVAAAAGLSPALVTRHFGSKRGLREAVDTYVLDRVDAEFRSALDALGVDPEGELMAALGAVSARVFGADPVLRGYLRHALVEGGGPGADLFGRLLSGARREVARLSEDRDGGPGEWAPFQLLCLVLGPLLLEQVMQPHLAEPMFAPEVLARRSAANQRLLLGGYYGEPEDGTGG